MCQTFFVGPIKNQVKHELKITDQIPKKAAVAGTQKWRIVIDYRKINDKTIDDRYPIPM